MREEAHRELHPHKTLTPIARPLRRFSEVPAAPSMCTQCWGAVPFWSNFVLPRVCSPTECSLGPLVRTLCAKQMGRMTPCLPPEQRAGLLAMDFRTSGLHQPLRQGFKEAAMPRWALGMEAFHHCAHHCTHYCATLPACLCKHPSKVAGCIYQLLNNVGAQKNHLQIRHPVC